MFSKISAGETHQEQPILEEGDIEEAIAANAIGDDTLQKEYQIRICRSYFQIVLPTALANSARIGSSVGSNTVT